MDEEYDVIVLGTGIKECILSALLSLKQKKVLNIDKNKYYGADSASINLEDLYNKFKPGSKPPSEMGNPRHWNVDLCPKFLMANGNLVKVLLHTDVTRYLEFLPVSGSYVYSDSKIHKVPVTATEALATPLLGFFEKRRFKNFLQWVNDYDISNPSTWNKVDIRKVTTKQVFENYDLSQGAVEFTGHAIALHDNDNYLNEPALDTIEKCKLYAQSLARFGSSPFIYPRYGIGGIPEGFARLCAINGGLQMLDKQVQEIVYGEDGKVIGVKVDDTIIKTKQVLADPSFLLNTPKVKKVHNICRAVCLLNHPIPNTNDADSLQIIIPAAQAKRKHDIYIALVSFNQAVSSKNWYIAVASTVQESSNPKDAESDLKLAFSLMGSIHEKFAWVSEQYVPTDDGTKDNVFVTTSIDASSHFEVATDEVLSIFPKMTGSPVDFNAKAEVQVEQ